MLGLFALILLGLLGAEVAIDFHPVKLSILFFILFWWPLLALHEAGHALVTVLLGWRVEKVVIGFGREVWCFRVGATPVELRMLPLEGFTRLNPGRTRRSGLKHFLIYAAGPGIEAVVLLGLLLVIGPEVLLERTENVPVIAAQTLAVAIVFGLFSNLVPHSVETSSGRSPNDGLGMLISLTGRDMTDEPEQEEDP